ncbi:MAG: hypothetical protein NT051_03185 [Candidatus Micrarchaeota archaeon]|nr:hypothetical protein [Candidatus Micrarchaeota archaeon]
MTKQKIAKAVCIGMVAGSLALSYKGAAQDAGGQAPVQNEPKVELLATPPNLSMQGLFPNPAVFLQTGDFVYGTYVARQGTDGAELMMNKSALGILQFTMLGATGTKEKPGAATLGIGIKPVDWLMIGYRASTQGALGEYGAIFKLDHTGRNLTQVGIAHNIGNRVWTIAIEERFIMGKGISGTVSGKIVKNQLGIASAGAGTGIATKNLRVWVGGEENLTLKTATANGGIQVVKEIAGKKVVFDSRFGIPITKNDLSEMLEKGTFRVGVVIPLGESARPFAKKRGGFAQFAKSVSELIKDKQHQKKMPVLR